MRGNQRSCLIWAGIGLTVLLGLGALFIDRVLAHFIYDHVTARATHKFLDRITHYAKAGHWLAIPRSWRWPARRWRAISATPRGRDLPLADSITASPSSPP